MNNQESGMVEYWNIGLNKNGQQQSDLFLKTHYSNIPLFQHFYSSTFIVPNAT